MPMISLPVVGSPNQSKLVEMKLSVEIYMELYAEVYAEVHVELYAEVYAELSVFQMLPSKHNQYITVQQFIRDCHKV